MKSNLWVSLFFLAHTLCCYEAIAQKQDVLQSVDNTRKGQHWVDAKTEPPKSPAESLKCFQIEPGLTIQLVASEPLVVDPVAIAFDAQGRLFVVEYRDYPTGPANETDPPLSRLVMLEDTDGDGKMDRRHLFADHLKFCNSLMPYKEGFLVSAQTEIIYLKDTDGDNQADLREVLFKGFKPHHEQMQLSFPRWGIDNWVTFNYGPGTITSSQKPDETFEMPRLDFRFHPLTMQFGPDSGLGQFGNTIDRWGHRFFCTNRNPIMVALLPYDAVSRNPYQAIPKAFADVAVSGAQSRVYPLVDMKSNWLSHAGTHTAACGVTAYLGDLLGEQYTNSVFVCEPVGHLVTRSHVSQIGISLTAKRARPQADFLASTDTWCRPASLANGPDGALYLADMYRLYVEAPRFFPEETVKKLKWRAGDDRGRIWRIAPTKATPRQFTPAESSCELVAMLNDPNSWRRYLAQRLLVERQDKKAVPAIALLISQNENPLTRLHAMWTLDGLNALEEKHLLRLLKDEKRNVKRDAITLAGSRCKKHPQLLAKLLTISEHADVLLRYQLVIATGGIDDRRVTNMLIKLAVRDGKDPWFATAIMTAAEKRSATILAGLVKQAVPEHKKLVRELATVAGVRGDEQELALLLDTIGFSKQQAAWWQTVAISGLAAGLPRHQGKMGRMSLLKLLSNPPEKLKQSAARIQEILARAATIAGDNDQILSNRVAAIELLSYQPFAQSEKVYQQLLASNQPVEVQSACIATMQKSGKAAVAKIILENWRGLGPQVRQPALVLLLRRNASTKQVLNAMVAGEINSAVIDIDRRVRLLRHRDAEIKSLAEKLFGGAVSTNRKKVATQYAQALKLKGSAISGQKVYDRVCANCHRIDSRGHEVGPDISDVRNRSREALLFDILDPNRVIDPKFTDYLILTLDGQTVNGLMAAETATAVILKQAKNKQQTIARNQIEEMQASGKSLMPEGVEKEISIQQMADLLEYLKARKSPEVE